MRQIQEVIDDNTSERIEKIIIGIRALDKEFGEIDRDLPHSINETLVGIEYSLYGALYSLLATKITVCDLKKQLNK